MVQVEVGIEIAHPASSTFDFIANPENNPKWQGGMKSCKIQGGQPLAVGTQYQQEAEFMGKKILTLFQITEYEPGSSIKGESIQSTFPITFKRIVEGDESHAKVKAIVTGEPKGLMGMLPFLTRWMIKRSITKDYQKLKSLLEAEQY